MKYKCKWNAYYIINPDCCYYKVTVPNNVQLTDPFDSTLSGFNKPLPGPCRTSAPAGLPAFLSQRGRYATYFDVAVLRCLLQPHWTEEGVHWALMYYLQRLRQILEERPERVPEPLVAPLPRPRSSSMVAATPSLVNTHKTQVMTTAEYKLVLHCSAHVTCVLNDFCFRLCFLQDLSLKCNEEGKSLSTETFTKVSLTNLRRQAVPDLASDLGINIFKKVYTQHSLRFFMLLL